MKLGPKLIATSINALADHGYDLQYIQYSHECGGFITFNKPNRSIVDVVMEIRPNTKNKQICFSIIKNPLF